MRLHQFVGSSTGPGLSLLLFLLERKHFQLAQDFFLGQVLPSNNVLTSDGT